MTKMKRIFGAISVLPILSAIGTGCTTADAVLPPPNESRLSGTAVPLARVATGDQALVGFSGYAQASRLVVRSAAELDEIWARVWSNGSASPVPRVDFRTQVVVVATAGERPSSGYDLVFTGAEMVGGSVQVRTRSVVPGGGCVVLGVITSPADVAILDTRAQQITFVDEARVHEC